MCRSILCEKVLSAYSTAEPVLKQASELNISYIIVWQYACKYKFINRGIWVWVRGHKLGAGKDEDASRITSLTRTSGCNWAQKQFKGVARSHGAWMSWSNSLSSSSLQRAVMKSWLMVRVKELFFLCYVPQEVDVCLTSKCTASQSKEWKRLV